MIIPDRKKDRRKSAAAWLITLMVSIAGYLLMIYMNAPDQRQSREIYREISMTELMEIPSFKPEIKEPVPEPDLNKPGSGEPDVTTAPAEPTPEPARAPSRIDLQSTRPDDLNNNLRERRPSRSHAEEASEPERRSLRMDEERSDEGRTGGFRTLRDRSSLQPGRTQTRGADGSNDSGLEMQTGDGTRDAGRREFSGSGFFPGDAGGRGDDEQTDPNVGLRELASLSQSPSELEDILKGLLEWMRDNPAELPRPVRRLMAEGRWDPAFLTSRVTITIDGNSYDLLLMLKEELYEVHILLVDGSRATYLIDRNFQRESNSLRIGGVQQRDGDIATISSQMEAASAEMAREFYQIFLTWWDSIQDEINR